MKEKRVRMRLIEDPTAKAARWRDEVVDARAEIDSLRKNFGMDREELLGVLVSYWDSSKGKWECTPAEAAYITRLSVAEVNDFYEWWQARERAYCLTTEFAAYRSYKQGVSKWSIGELMKRGLHPGDDKLEEQAIARVEKEAVPLGEVCDIMQEVGGRTVGIAEVLSQVEAAGVQCAKIGNHLSSGIAGFNYQNITELFDFSESSPSAFMEPSGLGALEKLPEYADLKKHPRWKQLKKRFATHGGGAA